MKALTRYSVLALIIACLTQTTPSILAIPITLLAWYLMGGKKTLYLIYHTGYRDFIMAKRFLHLLWVNVWCKLQDRTVGDLFLRTAERLPDKVMITLCQDEGSSHLTFKQARDLSCKVARYFQQQGFKKGDVVGLLLENRVDYCCYWLGLSFLGVVPALVNCNLRQQSLLHMVQVAQCKALIISKELTDAVEAVKSELDPSVSLFCVDPQPPTWLKSLPEELSPVSSSPLEEKLAGYNDVLFYIYTSGTTGLPKAALIKHSRYLFASYCLFCMGKVTEDDVLYSALPMYHTAGVAVCLGNTLTEGLTTVTRTKFSTSRFWKDCVENNVTCAQYIGEIARYLYSMPESKEEKQHQLRMMFGNGLRPQIWADFTARFNIKQINEFYGSTEGNCSCGNFSNRVGAVGFISVLFPGLLPMGIIRMDDHTGEPMRDPETGLAVPCEIGQPGELIGKIEKGHPVRDFHGYADKSATKQKIMHDVWKKGDMGFRSGDIFVMDEFGWLYFRDRVGDTFRWKGENVSTAEVEAVLSSVLKLRDCVVYGVEIPGCEGRAGMAAVPGSGLTPESWSELYRALEVRLPKYARPIFLRLVDKIDMTATYKLKKRDLQKEGFNPSLLSDSVLMVDTKEKSYLPLSQEQYNNIINGNIKV